MKNYLDLGMEESTCHEMIIHLSQRSSSMLCYVMLCYVYLFILYLFISIYFDFHVDTERIIVKKKMFGTIPFP